MPTSPDARKAKPMDDHADWVMSFVDDAAEDRQDMEPIWDETEASYMVRPYNEPGSNTNDPLDMFARPGVEDDFSTLKDPETHQAIMTVCANVALSTFPEDGFIKTTGVGAEDILGASETNKLLQYMHRLPGHFWVWVDYLMRTGLYGTAIMECGWHFVEGPQEFRRVGIDFETGQEVAEDEVLDAPEWDDPRLTVLDVRDFFPDPGSTNMIDMLGAAKRFHVTAAVAKERADAGFYRPEATKRAIESNATDDARERTDHPSDSTSDISHRLESHPDFQKMVGLEYYGTVPWTPRDGIKRRVITVLHGETVRSAPWPRRLPFFENRFIPRPNSFWGLALAEVIRYDQDLLDTFKSMMADAAVRSVHAPAIYAKHGEVEVDKLKRFRLGVPIGARSTDDVKRLNLDAPLGDMMGMYGLAKSHSREAIGTTDTVQGLGLGTKRASATEFQGTLARAQARPELYGQVFERETLPPIGRYVLGLYQQLLEPNTDDLARRIGQSNVFVPLSTIMRQFDIKYVGSRTEPNKIQQMQFQQQILAGAANPVIQQLVPWIPFLKKVFADNGLHEISAMVGDPELVKLHLTLAQLANPNAQSGNGANSPAQDPLGLPPAQTVGSAQ